MSDRSDNLEAVIDQTFSRYIGGGRCREGRDIALAEFALRLWAHAPEYPPRRARCKRARLTATGDERLQLLKEWEDLNLAHGIEARFSREIIDRFLLPDARRALGVVPDHVVHPDLLGGWGCKPNQSPKEEPDEAPR